MQYEIAATIQQELSDTLRVSLTDCAQIVCLRVFIKVLFISKVVTIIYIHLYSFFHACLVIRNVLLPNSIHLRELRIGGEI